MPDLRAVLPSAFPAMGPPKTPCPPVATAGLAMVLARNDAVIAGHPATVPVPQRLA